MSSVALISENLWEQLRSFAYSKKAKRGLIMAEISFYRSQIKSLDEKETDIAVEEPCYENKMKLKLIRAEKHCNLIRINKLLTVLSAALEECIADVDKTFQENNC